jgi:hypothetical protein
VSDERKFRFLEARNLNHNALDNTVGAVRLHCGQTITHLLDSV